MKTTKFEYYVSYVIPRNAGIFDNVSSGWIVSKGSDLKGAELVNWLYGGIEEKINVPRDKILIISIDRINSWREEVE